MQSSFFIGLTGQSNIRNDTPYSDHISESFG